MKRIHVIVAAVALSACASAQVDPARAVATVNGETIKGAEYYKRMEFLRGVGKRVGDSLIEAPPGFLTLLQLIGERLVLQLAKHKGVVPTDQAVQAELKFRLDGDPKLLENWSSTGLSQADLLHQIKVELARFKLQTQGITITDQEVETFYKNNKTAYTTPKGYKLRVIAVSTDKERQAADSALAGGKGFAEVAKQHSVDSTQSVGGAIGTVQLSLVPEATRKSIAATKIGSSTAWMDVNGKKVKYFVEDVVAEKVQPLDARTKVATRRRMMLDRGRVKNNLSKEIAELRSRSKVDIKQKEFAELYRRIVNGDALGDSG